jgi:hypothetical protein
MFFSCPCSSPKGWGEWGINSPLQTTSRYCFCQNWPEYPVNTGVSGPKSKYGVRTVTECVRTSRYALFWTFTGVSGLHRSLRSALNPENSPGDFPESPATPGTGVSGLHRSLRPFQVLEGPAYTGVSGHSTADLRKTAITFDPGVRFRRFWTLWKAYSEGYTSQLNSWPKTHRIKLGTLQNLFWTLPHFPLRTLNNKLSLWVWLGTLEHWDATISSRCIPLNSAAYLDSISKIKHIWTNLSLLNSFKYRFFLSNLEGCQLSYILHSISSWFFIWLMWIIHSFP